MACYYVKPSARTRNSTEMAVVQLGGHPIYITDAEVGIDTRESAEDVARTMACYHRVVCARVNEHAVLERMAALDLIPIVNLLSDAGPPAAGHRRRAHDREPVRHRWPTRSSPTSATATTSPVPWPWPSGCSVGEIRVSSPPGHRFDTLELDRLAAAGVEVEYVERPEDAVKGSDVVYTDTWVSMGQESEREARLKAFEGFQVDEKLMGLAGDAVFMHCLPAHRNEEVTDGVMDGDQSRIWVQAANRLHSARAVLDWVVEQHPSGSGRRGLIGAGVVAGKMQRQHRIVKLLGEEAVTSQGQLVDLLSEVGVTATQATVSRDLEELGAIKVRVPGGATVYAIPELPTEQLAPEDHLRRVLGEWLVEVARSGDLVILRTPPGSAHVVASALDRSGLPDLLGTVAGDDTLLAIAVEHRGADLAEALSELARPLTGTSDPARPGPVGGHRTNPLGASKDEDTMNSANNSEPVTRTSRRSSWPTPAASTPRSSCDGCRRPTAARS